MNMEKLPYFHVSLIENKTIPLLLVESRSEESS